MKDKLIYWIIRDAPAGEYGHEYDGWQQTEYEWRSIWRLDFTYENHDFGTPKLSVSLARMPEWYWRLRFSNKRDLISRPFFKLARRWKRFYRLAWWLKGEELPF